MPSKTVTDSVRELERELAVVNARLASVQVNVSRIDAMDIDRKLGVLESQFRAADPEAVRRQLAVLEDRVAELKRAKEETDRRSHGLLMIAVGAVLSLLGGVVVQLVAVGLRK